MKALILVGGQGTRLHPLTHAVPKPMVPIVNRPFLARMIEWLRRHDLTEIILTIGYLPEVVRDCFGDGRDHGVHIEYVVEEAPLGTGGAIKNAESLLDSTFVAFNGDILTDINLGDIIVSHTRRAALATLTLIEVDDPSRFGVIEMSADCRVHAFLEKPAPGTTTSRTINGGIYVLEPEVLRRMPTGAFSIEHDFYPRVLADGALVAGYVARGYWKDVGTIRQYLEAHDDLLHRRVRNDLPGRAVRSGVWVEEQAQLADGAVIEPPAVIGPGAVIERGAHLTGGVTVGRGARIGAGAQVHHAVLWPESIVEVDASVRSSILGTRARVETGAVLDERALGQEEVHRASSSVAS